MSGQISDHTSEAGLPSAHGYFSPRVSRRYASLQKNVRSGPHAIHIENLEVSMRRTTDSRLRGQLSGGPSGVAAQSTSRRSAPTWPLRANISLKGSPSPSAGPAIAVGLGRIRPV